MEKKKKSKRRRGNNDMLLLKKVEIIARQKSCFRYYFRICVPSRSHYVKFFEMIVLL